MYLPYRGIELNIVNYVRTFTVATPFKLSTTAATLKHQAWKLLITSPVHLESPIAS